MALPFKGTTNADGGRGRERPRTHGTVHDDDVTTDRRRRGRSSVPDYDDPSGDPNGNLGHIIRAPGCIIFFLLFPTHMRSAYRAGAAGPRRDQFYFHLFHYAFFLIPAHMRSAYRAGAVRPRWNQFYSRPVD